MRYILDSNGYIDSVSCTPFNCKDKSCQEYTGAIPTGYSSLAEWATTANIRAYKITNGNLTLDANKKTELENEWNGNGWKAATLTSNFATYSTGYEVRYRKIGKNVEINGVVKPTTALTNGGNDTTIFTLPAEYRPSRALQVVCQGSGSNRWLLTVNTGGTVNVSRYGTTSFIEIPSGAWLPFNVSYMVD